MKQPPSRGAGALRVGVTRGDAGRGAARAPVAAVRLADAVREVLRAERVASAMISVTLLSARAMAQLNQRHLRHAGATDVISFGFAPVPGAGVVGDIYLCPDVVRANATAARCGVREELLRLVVHGTLHVLGWDHPEDASRTASPMWRRQERLLARVRRRGVRAA
ncbi:MAG: rRNA maturation RNase YbeY [Gemmatimonadetes bacterium]|nr:rRNA maturation RNase YbeY [Gemmatimonadota bacterium]